MKKPFLLFLILTISHLALFGQNDRFYTPSDGLSGTSVRGIFQDSRGYLWISLFSSLNRFDGYNFRVYEHKENDSTTISSTYTNVVYEDLSKRLWIGTDKGLSLYDYTQDCFRKMRFYFKETEISLNVKGIIEDSSNNLWLVTSYGVINFNTEDHKYIFYNHRFQSNGEPSFSSYNQAIIDNEDNIWIATDDEGVLIFDTREKKFYTIPEFTGSNYQFPDRSIMALHQTKTGHILFGTSRKGIVVYDPANKIFNHTSYSASKEDLLDRGIHNIITDRKGTIWIGTEGNGIKTFDVNQNQIKDVNYMVDVPGISKSRVFCYEDKQGDMWFGIQERGIYLKLFSSKAFHSIGNSKSDPQLSHFLVSSVLTDRNGNFWIATEGGGINVRWKGESNFEIFNSSGSEEIIKDKSVTKLFEDKRGWIWIGTYYEGLYCYQGKDKPLLHYHIPGFENEPRRNYIFDLTQDAKGNILIGSNGGGLYYLNVTSGNISDFSNQVVAGKTESIHRYIYALEYDSDSSLWIATDNGLFYWNKQKDIFRSFQVSTGDLTNDLVTSLKKDNEGNMWIGTISGLYRYLPEKQTLQRFGVEDGLCSNSVKAIEPDKHGRLWISTTAGISKFDIPSGVFTNYFISDGLPCDKYVIGSSFQVSDGIIYFGGVDGLVYFHPDSIVDNPNKPNLIFTSFKIFNQEIKYNSQTSKNILFKDINATDTLLLPYSDKSFTIEFAAINFSSPEKIKYAVQLEGFNSNWEFKDFKQRYATYTNLSPGTYVFNLKSTNLEGLWPGNERKLTIVITPPFWLTWWAFVIYGAVIVILIYYIRKILIFRLQIKNELRIEHLEREKLEEINKSKMQFFTNISHEIRTPLTLITAPLEKLLESPLDNPQKKLANYIYRNTKRMERMVNQLLELQKIENTQFRLKAREIDLVTFLKEIVSLFDEKANEKNIHLAFESGCDKLMAWIDPEKMDKVIFNLLSNAFKFTLPGGLITVSVNKKNENVGTGDFIISVSDSGRGMDKIHLERIFERFYQIENKETGQITGTGIGLHLSKELVEKHHGTLTVTSRQGFGSTFTITMPLGNNHLLPDEIFTEQPLITGYYHEKQADISDLEPETGENVDEEFAEAGKTMILIVEDDIDILNYLEDELSDSYQIIKANNGHDGWKQAFDKVPDLIVSDIMMPGIDGLELCKKLKTSIETSHIPVILLTAKTSLEHEIEGLETGADDYIHKPFHPRLLKLKVDKIIESRELLKQKFSKVDFFTVKEMTVTSADEKFLQKAITFVKDNLSDTELNIEKMGSTLNISRVHLYRKLKAITNQNPTEFIRIIRLKQAAYLLSQNKLNISEIAYMVGFNSHQYFTNSFQKHFGMSPTEYSRKEEQSKII